MPARGHQKLSTKVKHAVKKVTGQPTKRRGTTGRARGGKKTVVREHVRKTPAKKTGRTTNKGRTTGKGKGRKTATLTAKVSV